MQSIASLCWKSYYPTLKRIVSGTASPTEWKQLDTHLLEDYEDLETPQLLEVLLKTCMRIVQNHRLEDNFYNAVEEGIVDRLFSLRVWEKDCPDLYAVTSEEAAKTLGKRLQQALRIYVCRMHDDELYHCAYEQFYLAIPAAIRRRHAALRQRMERRCNIFKEELIAAAWAPARVERWLEAGLELENL